MGWSICRFGQLLRGIKNSTLWIGVCNQKYANIQFCLQRICLKCSKRREMYSCCLQERKLVGRQKKLLENIFVRVKLLHYRGGNRVR